MRGSTWRSVSGTGGGSGHNLTGDGQIASLFGTVECGHESSRSNARSAKCSRALAGAGATDVGRPHASTGEVSVRR